MSIHGQVLPFCQALGWVLSCGAGNTINSAPVQYLACHHLRENGSRVTLWNFWRRQNKEPFL
ncbi:hypothetical protein MC7420_4248 [Coleofasciculus chthonoplastes PCC 7420]|uniref:Uncharacterized protein n=1 Tax=Coleofasciculus chthonoplastes PCC 7420 TaxID=118168 RepID=B4VV52_9CYAN|nr:hypothetical protein MC7420_4248 [Coleofasciculus chthonoplastes PCC 7420]